MASFFAGIRQGAQAGRPLKAVWFHACCNCTRPTPRCLDAQQRCASSSKSRCAWLASRRTPAQVRLLRPRRL